MTTRSPLRINGLPTAGPRRRSPGPRPPPEHDHRSKQTARPRQAHRRPPRPRPPHKHNRRSRQTARPHRAHRRPPRPRPPHKHNRRSRQTARPRRAHRRPPRPRPLPEDARPRRRSGSQGMGWGQPMVHARPARPAQGRVRPRTAAFGGSLGGRIHVPDLRPDAGPVDRRLQPSAGHPSLQPGENALNFAFHPWVPPSFLMGHRRPRRNRRQSRAAGPVRLRRPADRRPPGSRRHSTRAR